VGLIHRQRPIFRPSYSASGGGGGAPSISSVSGTRSDGSTLTISGSNFGSSPTTSLIDYITNQSVYSAISDGAVVPVGTGKVWAENTADSVGSHTNAMRINRSISRGARTTGYRGFGQCHLDWPNIFVPNYPSNTSSSEKKYYQSWWFKPSISPNAHGGSNKFTRIWDEVTDTGVRTHFSWTWTESYYVYEDSSQVEVYADWTGTTAAWNRLEVFIDGDTNEFFTYVNGTLLQHGTSAPKRNNGFGFATSLLGFNPGGAITDGVYDDLTFDITDFYAGTDRARVEIATESTWAAARGKGEVQDVSSRSSSTIVLNAVQGGLSAISGKYIYVVATDETANSSGFLL